MITIDESARPARVDDLYVIDALVGYAIGELEPLRGGAVWARREARASPAVDDLRAALDDASQLLLVGMIDDVVVGYAALQRATLRDGGALAILGDVYVLPGARGVGVGEAMLELGLDWARDQGCIGLDSLALPGDRDTKNFFESFGLVARAIVVHRDLSDRIEGGGSEGEEDGG